MSIAAIAAAGVPAVFQLVQSLLPMLPTAGAGVVGSVISVLMQYGPLVVSEYKALRPVYDDAVDAIENNDASTTDQIAKLRALVKADDAEFDAALAKSRSEDPPAGQN